MTIKLLWRGTACCVLENVTSYTVVPHLPISHLLYHLEPIAQSNPVEKHILFTPLFHLWGIMVLVQQSVQQFSHVALLLWFFINQRQVFPSQLVKLCWCERLSGFIVCHWLLQSAVWDRLAVFSPHHTGQVLQTQMGHLGDCGVEIPHYQFYQFNNYLLVLPICYSFTAWWQ